VRLPGYQRLCTAGKRGHEHTARTSTTGHPGTERDQPPGDRPARPEADLDTHIAELVAVAPPLTSAQRDRLTLILRRSPPPTPAIPARSARHHPAPARPGPGPGPGPEDETLTANGRPHGAAPGPGRSEARWVAARGPAGSPGRPRAPGRSPGRPGPSGRATRPGRGGLPPGRSGPGPLQNYSVTQTVAGTAPQAPARLRSPDTHPHLVSPLGPVTAWSGGMLTLA
jgi:hypothetical protein